MNRNRVYKWGCRVVAAVLLLLLPALLPELKIHLVIEIFIFALFAISFNLLYGYTGLLDFGHAALFGVGAYTTALLITHLPSMHLLLILIIAALSGIVTGAVVGFFCVRLKGAYFALLTLAFQMFLYAVALKWRSLTNGDDGMGISRPELWLPMMGNVSLMNIHNLYYLTLVIVALGIFTCYFFLKTPFGNSVLCMRENDIRASFLGYNVFLTKLAVFSVSGLWAGLAGGLFVLFQEFVATNCIDMNMSMSVVLMTVMGGTGQFLGPVLGAAFYIVFQDWVSSITKNWWLIMGVVFIVVILYLEGGLISLFKWERIGLGNSGRGKANGDDIKVREGL